MKSSPRTIGFVQAAGLTLYVSLFATIVQQGQNWALFHGIEASPTMSMVLFLLAFVTSALICSSIALGYPLVLFFSDKHGEAIKTILWTLLWLVVIALCIAGFSLFFLQRA